MTEYRTVPHYVVEAAGAALTDPHAPAERFTLYADPIPQKRRGQGYPWRADDQHPAFGHRTELAELTRDELAELIREAATALAWQPRVQRTGD